MSYFRYLFIGIFMVALASCATNRVDLRTYSSPSISDEDIQSVAIFPIRNTRLAAGDSRELSRAFNRGFKDVNPNINIMNDAQSTSALNENNIVTEYTDFLRDFSVSGVPDTRSLNLVGNALGVDSIVQGEIVEISQRDGAMGGKLATTTVTVRYYLLSTRSGELLWESTARSVKQPTVSDTGLSRSVFTPPPPIFLAIQEAQDQIISSIPVMD